MNRAPAVSFSTSRSRWHLRFVVAIIVSAGLVSVAFSIKQPQSGWSIFAIANTLLIASVFSLSSWRKSAVGQLRWDGQCWYWSVFGDPSVCDLMVRLDWQSGMLVTLKGKDQPTVWLWLDAPSDVANWNSLRRAVFSRHSAFADEEHPDQLLGDGA